LTVTEIHQYTLWVPPVKTKAKKKNGKKIWSVNRYPRSRAEPRTEKKVRGEESNNL